MAQTSPTATKLIRGGGGGGLIIKDLKQKQPLLGAQRSPQCLGGNAGLLQ